MAALKKQIQAGAIIAYVNILINTFISLFLTPFIIGKLGSSEYGVYKIISSFSANLGVISFGISSLVARNVVFFNTKKQQKEKENFLFMAQLESLILFLLVLICGIPLYIAIDPLYSKSLSDSELLLAKRLFIFFVLNVAINILCDTFSGMIKAHEKFVILNIFITMRSVLRLFSLVILLSLGVKSFGIVLTDLVINTTILLLSVFYSKVILKEKAKFYYFDKQVFKSGLAFSMAIFLQAIINQFNNNLDNVILGAMKGSDVVTVYSVALTIYTMFNSFVTVIGGMYGPKATRLVAEGADGNALTLFAIKPARIQAIMALFGILSFALVGKDFIYLWLGNGFSDVYLITLILIIPVVLPLIESVTNAILDAMLKRLARSIILALMCIANLLVSIFFIKNIGYIGAAFGTAFSLILGHGIIMNIYLHKKIKLNIPKLLLEIFRGILPCTIASFLICSFVFLLPVGWIWLIVKILIILMVFFITMYLWGINDDEKATLNGFFSRLVNHSEVNQSDK